MVRAYLAASSAHDVATMNALVDPKGQVYRTSRFERTWVVDDVHVSGARRADEGIDPADNAWADWQESVDVDFNATSVHGGTDFGLDFPDGQPATWGFVLGRHSATGPWLLIGQGVG